MLPADKGGATVVVDADEYKEKAIQQLPNATRMMSLLPTPR